MLDKTFDNEFANLETSRIFRERRKRADMARGPRHHYSITSRTSAFISSQNFFDSIALWPLFLSSQKKKKKKEKCFIINLLQNLDVDRGSIKKSNNFQQNNSDIILHGAIIIEGLLQ